MIATVSGTIAHISESIVVVDTALGVGYELYTTPNAIGSKQVGDEVRLYTYLQVREDAHTLFGFASLEEKKFFTLLLSVSGVGPKTAFSIVSHLSFQDAVTAVRSQKVEVFSTITGIGKKTAMKIVLELSQLFKTEFTFESELSEGDKTVIDALVSLGFAKKEAQTLFKKLDSTLSIEQKIQKALQLSTQRND